MRETDVLRQGIWISFRHTKKEGRDAGLLGPTISDNAFTAFETLPHSMTGSLHINPFSVFLAATRRILSTLRRILVLHSNARQGVADHPV